MIQEIIFWILLIGLHEFGHYAYFKLIGYKPVIKPTWIGIEVERPEMMTIYDDMLGCLTGILTGLPLAYLGNVLFIYYVLCTIDIVKILVDIDLGFKYGFKVTEIDLCKIMLKNYKNKVRYNGRRNNNTRIEYDVIK